MLLENKDRQLLIDLLGELPVHCYATFLSAKVQTSDDRVWLGDLFVTSGGIVFFPYADPRPQPLDPTSYITANTTANTIANCCRAWLIGASIEDRIRRHKGKAEPIVIPTVKIGTLVMTESESNGGNQISINTDNQQVLVKVDKASTLKQAIDDLMCGSPKQRPDTEFANLRLPPLGWLFQQFASGDVTQLRESGVIDDIAQHREYVECFTSYLSQTVASTRTAVTETIERTPGRFAEMFREAQSMRAWLRRAVWSSAKGCLATVIVSLVLIAVFYFWAFSQSDPKYLHNLEKNLSVLSVLAFIAAFGFLGATSGFFGYPLPPRYGVVARIACVGIPAAMCAIPLMVMADSFLAICAAFFAGLVPAIRQFGGGDEIQINIEATEAVDPPSSNRVNQQNKY
jgi:hypothetical protein